MIEIIIKDHDTILYKKTIPKDQLNMIIQKLEQEPKSCPNRDIITYRGGTNIGD